MFSLATEASSLDLHIKRANRVRLNAISPCRRCYHPLKSNGGEDTRLDYSFPLREVSALRIHTFSRFGRTVHAFTAARTWSRTSFEIIPLIRSISLNSCLLMSSMLNSDLAS